MTGLYTGTSATNTQIAWGSWNAGTITAVTNSATTGTWNVWIKGCNVYGGTGITITTSGSSVTAAAWYGWNEAHEVVQETKRQKRARREVARLEAEAAAAKARARKLLVEHLSELQRKTLEDKGYFDVDVGGKTYRIRNGTHGNVRLLENGAEKTSYCIQPPGVPEGDAMLAQKLWLETDERAFLQTANARPL